MTNKWVNTLFSSAVMTKKLLLGVLKIMMGLLTGHCHLKGHLFKLGPVNGPDTHTNLKRPHKFFATVRHRQYKDLGTQAIVS
jgi:hypothetical protein